ncbi:F0F1 ATP synthase subunit delta [Ectothiorhodospiraceae bacterium 2226]|nr:F0F1 ATP synthase subunit delta [Ectothiorhodospiraceae bacterium 2226]
MAESTTIARPYAQAAFEVAREHNALARWSEMLQWAAQVAADAQMAALIKSPHVSREDLVQIILDVCGDNLDEQGRNLIRTLAANGRLELLPDIAALFEMLRADAEGTVEAEVVSALPVSDAQQAIIADALAKRLGRKVALRCRTDEALLGGAIIRAGDLVIDGSARGHLNKLATALLR